MRNALRLALIAALIAPALGGCVVTTVAGAAVGITSAAVGATAQVAGAAVGATANAAGAGVRAVTGGGKQQK